MAKKIDYMKYLALGAGAALTPGLVAKVPAITDLLAKVTFLTTPVLGVSLQTILLAGLGVGLVDMLVYK